MPLINLAFLTFDNMVAKASTTRLDKKGDNGSPCLNSLWVLKNPLGSHLYLFSLYLETQLVVSILYIFLDPPPPL
jgi:hypothetical protein